MKKQFTHAIGKKAFTLLAAAIILIGSASRSFATPDRTTAKAMTADISYTGAKDQYLVFRVDYKNDQSQEFQLVIKNDQQDVLFSKKFDAKPLNTDIFLSELPDNCKLTFLIRTGKKEESQTFEINKTYKTVPEIAVKGI